MFKNPLQDVRVVQSGKTKLSQLFEKFFAEDLYQTPAEKLFKAAERKLPTRHYDIR